MNLRVILSAVGAAALLASPAMAKTRHAPVAAPAQVDTRAQAPQVVAPYAASVPVTTHRAYGLNPDFQISADR